MSTCITGGCLKIADTSLAAGAWQGLSAGNLRELMEVNTAMLQQGRSDDAMTIAQACTICFERGVASLIWVRLSE